MEESQGEREPHLCERGIRAGGKNGLYKEERLVTKRRQKACTENLPRSSRRMHEWVSGRNTSPGGSGKSWFHFKSGQTGNENRGWETNDLLIRRYGEMSLGDSRGGRKVSVRRSRIGDERQPMMARLVAWLRRSNQGCGSGCFSTASTNKKRPLTIYFNFCGSVPCFLLHVIILRKQKPSFIAITLPTSLELIIPNYSVFFFLDIITRVECRTVLFNLFVIAEPLMYFRVCHGTPTNKNLEITNCLQENQIFRYYNSKNN